MEVPQFHVNWIWASATYVRGPGFLQPMLVNTEYQVESVLGMLVILIAPVVLLMLQRALEVLVMLACESRYY